VEIPNPTAEIDKCQTISDPNPRIDCFANIDKMLMETAVPWIPYLWNKVVYITAPSMTKYEFDQFSTEISITHVAVNNKESM
jgi:hypothetical protein